MNKIFEMTEIEIYKKLEIDKRYSRLLEKYNIANKDPFEKIDKKFLLAKLKELGFTVKYYPSEKFYHLIIQECKYGFINLVIKYGYLECGFYYKRDNNKVIGSTINTMCLRIELSKGIERPNMLRNICIGSYDEIIAVIYELVEIYKDFYQIITEQYIKFGN